MSLYYSGLKNIIQGPDALLNFDKSVEGNKKTEGRSVIEALKMADSFVTAFIFRLDEGGDLSGTGTELKSVDVPAGMTKEEEEAHDMDFLDEIADSMKDKNEP